MRYFKTVYIHLFLNRPNPSKYTLESSDYEYRNKKIKFHASVMSLNIDQMLEEKAKNLKEEKKETDKFREENEKL